MTPKGHHVSIDARLAINRYVDMSPTFSTAVRRFASSSNSEFHSILLGTVAVRPMIVPGPRSAAERIPVVVIPRLGSAEKFILLLILGSQRMARDTYLYILEKAVEMSALVHPIQNTSNDVIMTLVTNIILNTYSRCIDIQSRRFVTPLQYFSIHFHHDDV